MAKLNSRLTIPQMFECHASDDAKLVENVVILLQEKWPLTTKDLTKLARKLDPSKLESIAQIYFEFEPETLSTLKVKHRENIDMYKFEILDTWKCNTGRGRQVRKPLLVETLGTLCNDASNAASTPTSSCVS